VRNGKLSRSLDGACGIEVCRNRYVPCRPNSSIKVPYKKAVKDFAVSGSVAPMVLDSAALHRGYLT
jgi:hypothetical protein